VYGESSSTDWYFLDNANGTFGTINKIKSQVMVKTSPPLFFDLTEIVVFILKKIKKIQIVINANKNTVNGLLKKL
jgi:hypothetical protein